MVKRKHALQLSWTIINYHGPFDQGFTAMRISLSYSVFWYVHRNSLSHNDFSFKTRRTTASWIQDSHVPCMQRMRIIIFVQNSYSYSNLLSVLKLSIYSWNHESTFGFHFFFFFSFFFSMSRLAIRSGDCHIWDLSPVPRWLQELK